MRLFELFDKTYPYELQQGNMSGMSGYMGSFKTDNTEFLVMIGESEPGYYKIGFSDTSLGFGIESQSVTNRQGPKAFKALATVGEMVREVNPEVGFELSARKSEPSRVKAYRRMSTLISSEMNMEMHEEDGNEFGYPVRKFIFLRPDREIEPPLEG